MKADDWIKIHRQVDARDAPQDRPFGSIQWKGTSVCIDLYCKCGAHLHFDGEFFFGFDCPRCKQRYHVGTNVRLIPLDSEEERAWAEDSIKQVDFGSDEPESYARVSSSED